MSTQTVPQPQRTYEPLNEYALIDIGGNILTWNCMSVSEARDANLELESDGALLSWFRLEFVN